MSLISYNQALKIIEQQALKAGLKTQELNLNQSLGFTCVEDILAPIDLQPFDNSAMDGFMVLAEDLKNASEENKIVLTNKGIVQAGVQSSNFEIQSGTCIKVMTGAVVAKNATAVIKIEDVEVNGDKVYFSKQAKHDENIRRKGEDIKKNSVAVVKNTTIEPKHIALLSSLGIAKIKVYAKPKVLYLSTGNELAEGANKLQEGQIYNSNMPYSLAYLKSLGVEDVSFKTIKDSEEDFIKTVNLATKEGFNIIISSGAVSKGDFDFVKSGLLKLNAKILYHKIKLRPGKPNLFAMLPQNIAYFGLPGNPLANIVGLRFFATSYINCLQNKNQEQPNYALLANDFTKKESFAMFLRAKLETNQDAKNIVTLANGQASFMVNSFSASNCFVLAEEEANEIKQGSVVKVYGLLPKI